MKQSKKTNSIATLAILLFSAACGGGGGGANQENIELTAVPDGAVTPMGASIEILIGTNDVGPAEEVQITLEPTHGTLSEEGPVAITYTPEPGFAGLDNFEYRMKVGNSLSESVRVKVLVTEEVVFLDGEGGASSLRYVLTDGESALSNSPIYAGMQDDAQGLPSELEGDLDFTSPFQIDLSTISDYVVSPDGRWIAALGSEASPQGGVGKKLMVIDRVTHANSRVHTVSMMSAIQSLGFSATGEHLMFCTSVFGSKTLRTVSLQDGLPGEDSAELALPLEYSGRVISYELSPDADVCAIRLFDQNGGGEALYAIDLNQGSGSLQRMTTGEIFETFERTSPQFAWLPSGEGADLHVLVYRSDVGAEEGEFQLYAKEMAEGTNAWRIDTDGGVNHNAAVSSFAISPDGTKVAYRKDGEIQGVQAIYVNTMSQLALHDARVMLTPGAGSLMIEGYVWDASSEVIYGQLDDGGLFPGPSELHVYTAELSSGIQELVSDAEGIEAGLIALGEGDMTGVLYTRSYTVSLLGSEFPLSAVGVWSLETRSGTNLMTGLPMQGVQLSRDGARVVVFQSGDQSRHVAVAAVLESPLGAVISMIAGPERSASKDSFSFLSNSDRWVYLDIDSGDLMLGGVDLAERVISEDRPTSREITSLPSVNG